MCFSLWKKYYYDTDTNTCRGTRKKCLKEGNKFSSLADCQRTCHSAASICDLDYIKGSWWCWSSNFPYRKTRYYYDYDTKECLSFKFKGGYKWCSGIGNGNNFLTAADCKATCICDEEKDTTTSCGSTSTRYWYNKETNRCEDYTGCELDTSVSGNNFETEALCKATCRYQSDYCLMDTETKYSSDEDENECDEDDEEDLWQYDDDDDSCVTYEGCASDTGNTFSTQADCEMECLMDDS